MPLSALSSPKTISKTTKHYAVSDLQHWKGAALTLPTGDGSVVGSTEGMVISDDGRCEECGEGGGEVFECS